jgi:hypothetical protein
VIYNGLRAVAEAYDIFIFDAYGVFWEGNGFYAGSREVMADLVRSGKTVVVVSNSSALSSDLIASYDKRGLKQGVHYQYLISSGDLLKQRLQSGQISFSSSPNPQKYYVIGKPHQKAFAGTKYVQVSTLAEADFVYIGVPFMFADDVAQYPQYMNEYWPVAQDENGQITVWDTLTPAPFEQIVDDIAYVAKKNHIRRVKQEKVHIKRNFAYAEVLNDLERISDHCSNISTNLIQSTNASMQRHELKNKLKAEDTSEFAAQIEEFKKQYSLDLISK